MLDVYVEKRLDKGAERSKRKHENFIKNDPEAASTVGGAKGTTAELLVSEQTRLLTSVSSNSADQQSYSAPPTNDSIPLESVDTCSGWPEVLTATHPPTAAAGQPLPTPPQATFNVVPGFAGVGSVPVTSSCERIVPGAADTVGGLINVFVATAEPASHT